MLVDFKRPAGGACGLHVHFMQGRGGVFHATGNPLHNVSLQPKWLRPCGASRRICAASNTPAAFFPPRVFRKHLESAWQATPCLASKQSRHPRLCSATPTIFGDWSVNENVTTMHPFHAATQRLINRTIQLFA